MNEKPLFSSMHTHTVFCDGEDDIETMCRTAYEKNLYAIGFSAHAPIEKQLGIKSEWNLKDEKADEYIAEVLSAKKRWHGKLKVFLGYEADYIKGKRTPADSDIISKNLDYVIGSVHFLCPEGTEPFTVDGGKEEFEKGLNEGYGGDALKLMNSYYDAVLEMISTGGFDILGHADIIKKNTYNRNLWPKEKEIARQREVAAAAAGKNFAIEVNTGGINRKKINDIYPSLTFLKIIQKYIIPVIITSDAHCARHINENYDIAIKIIKSANIIEHYLFNGRTDKEPLWISEKINKI